MISLADLKSRRVPVEWFEAVAIVQALCRVLLESGVDPEKTSLGSKDVFIDSDGSVRFAQNAGEKGEPAIRQIGELLRTSLAESTFPVPLRLVITQASSTPPFYASIAELSNALEYFERPDRPGLIRAVYERAQGYQPVSDVVNQDAQQPEDEKPARRDKRQPRRIPRSAIAASAAAAMVIVLVLVVSRFSTAPRGNAAGADEPKKDRRCVDRDRFFSGRAGRSREPFHGELVTRPGSSSRQSEDHRRIAAARLSERWWQGSTFFSARRAARG